MNTRLKLSRVALCLFALLSVATAQNRTFTNQYSFGDSLSDSGNLFAATSALGAGTPGAPYFQGRFTNGRVFTELLGNNLALVATSPTSVKSRLNFAHFLQKVFSFIWSSAGMSLQRHLIALRKNLERTTLLTFTLSAAKILRKTHLQKIGMV